MIKTLIILILILGWLTPAIAFLLNRRKNDFDNYVGAVGSLITLLLIFLYLFLPKIVVFSDPVETEGLGIIALYLVIIGYGLLGYRSYRKAKLAEPDHDTRIFLFLFLLAGILGIILMNYLPLIIVSWFVIVLIVYRLITYQDIDLVARQDYRDRLKKDYLDRF